MSQPIRQINLGLKKSSMPNDKPNKGFEVETGKEKPSYKYSDWEGTVKGKTKHTYKAGN